MVPMEPAHSLVCAVMTRNRGLMLLWGELIALALQFWEESSSFLAQAAWLLHCIEGLV